MAVLWSLQKAAEWIGCLSRPKAGPEILVPPFAVMAGSGLTSFQARQLCRLAEQHLLSMGLPLPRLPDSFPARYLEVFSLFPSGWHLQEFLEIHLKNREPSAACRELAILLTPNCLTDLVLTVNFCDEIPDAVRERGLEPLVLDHPDEIRQRLLLSRPRLQIVKLHGDYRHFDSCNLEAELKRRGRQVRGKVLEVLAERSMLVLGYSGWKGDAFLSALKYHLTRRTTFPGCIWWFCYSDDDYWQLPRWLVQSPYVRMVTPSASNRNFLDGREVLSSLRMQMERFREATPVAVPGAVRRRLDGVLDVRPGTDSGDRILRQAYYVTVESNPWLGLSLAKERQRLLGTPVAIELGACSYKTVCFLEARYGEGFCLRQLGRPEEALVQFRSVAEQASFDEPLLRGRYAHARNGEAVTLADLGRHDEAFAVWSHVVDLPASEDPQVRQARDFALNNLWLTQWRLGLAEQMQTFALLLRQLSASDDPLVLSLVGRAVDIRLAELREAERVCQEHAFSGEELANLYELVNLLKTTGDEMRALRDGREIDFKVREVGEGPGLVKAYPAAADLLRAVGKCVELNAIKEAVKDLERELLIGIPEEERRQAIDAVVAQLYENKGRKIAPTFKEVDEARQQGDIEEALVGLALLRRAVEVRLAEVGEAKPVREQRVSRTGSVGYEKGAFGSDELLNPYPAVVDETRAKRGDEKIDIMFKEAVKARRAVFVPAVCISAVGDNLYKGGSNRWTADVSTATWTATSAPTPSLSSNRCRRRLSSAMRMANSRSRSAAQMFAAA